MLKRSSASLLCLWLWQYSFVFASPCGVTEHELVHDGVKRHFNLYVPPSMCGTADTKPLLVAVHCYGCTAHNEYLKYFREAEKYGFALLTPEGYMKSWNAKYCCGLAVKQDLDDVGFITRAVELSRQLTNISAKAIFVTGFSNGGFMSSTLGTQVPWVKGIAPTAGHTYDTFNTNPLPVFLHHSKTDMSVSYSGCCGDKCCCGISSKSCVSTPAIFKRWLDINQCKSQEVSLGVGGIECITGIGCAANTTLCSYADVVHQAWARGFPLAGQVVEFFAKEACSIHGTWDTELGKCRCNQGHLGTWCLNLDSSDVGALFEYTKERRNAKSSSFTWLLVSGFAFFLAFLFLFWRFSSTGSSGRERIRSKEDGEELGRNA